MITNSMDLHYEVQQSSSKELLFNQVSRVSAFLRRFRLRLNYGGLSRAQIKLLRFELEGVSVKCHWLARQHPAVERGQANEQQRLHYSMQVLKDAIDIRSMLFESLPQIEEGYLEVYRNASISLIQERIVLGYVQRNDHSSRNLHSIERRARNLGFNFQLESGDLQPLRT